MKDILNRTISCGDLVLVRPRYDVITANDLALVVADDRVFMTGYSRNRVKKVEGVVKIPMCDEVKSAYENLCKGYNEYLHMGLVARHNRKELEPGKVYSDKRKEYLYLGCLRYGVERLDGGNYVFEISGRCVLRYADIDAYKLRGEGNKLNVYRMGLALAQARELVHNSSWGSKNWRKKAPYVKIAEHMNIDFFKEERFDVSDIANFNAVYEIDVNSQEQEACAERAGQAVQGQKVCYKVIFETISENKTVEENEDEEE